MTSFNTRLKDFKAKFTLRPNQKVNADGNMFGDCEYLVNADVGTTITATVNNENASSSWSSASQPSCQAMTHNLGAGVFPSPILHLDSHAVGLPDFPGDSKPDDVIFDEGELGSVENHKGVLLHLLSQLTVDMDLTKIVLPTFILEKRSLLEMFADYLAHPELFLAINQAEDAESRMIAFVQWYLTAFHAGRKDKVAKKPYNPIIGESFHCCWVLPAVASESELVDATASVNSAPTASSNCPTDDTTQQPVDTDQPAVSPTLITYCAEQVSHHPPVTAFRFQCPQHQITLDSFVHTKSKFQGMSVSVGLLGKTVLRLGEHQGEEYHFAFPTAYARSILTIPWVELGDKVSITCPQTGYSAWVNFHTKPMRSSKLHRISGEIHAPGFLNIPATADRTKPSTLVARVSGEWNNSLEFEQFTKGGRKWSINVNRLTVTPKLVRPVEQQRPEESRRLWQLVTEGLRAGNVQLATEHKRELEKRQRISEKYRIQHRIPFPIKYFESDGTSWVFYPRTELQPVTSPVPRTEQPNGAPECD